MLFVRVPESMSREFKTCLPLSVKNYARRSLSSNVPAMLLNIRLFARAKDLAGSETISVEVPDNATVGDLRSALRDQFPGLEPVIPNLHVAIGTDYANDSATLNESQSISCFPPVSGG